MRPNPTRRAIVLLEACVAIMLVGMVLFAVSMLIASYAKSTDYFLNYRRAQLAAESYVERIRAGAVPPDDADFTDEANITLRIRTTTAEGNWAPLLRVEVEASIVGKHSRVAAYKLATYVAVADSPKGEPR